MTEYSSYYESAAHSYDALRFDRDEEVEATCKILLDSVGEPHRVLEVGCGTGRHAAFLQSRERLVIGLDRSIAQLRHAGALRIRVQADAKKLPLRPRAVDAVLAVLMIHQMPAADRPVAFREWLRVLRPGGYLLIKTCAHSDLDTRWVEQYFPTSVMFNKARYPDIPVLADELDQAGFMVEATIPTRTHPAFPVQMVLDAVRARHNTTLYRVPADEFATGVSRLSAELRTLDSVTVVQAHTHVLARRLPHDADH